MRVFNDLAQLWRTCHGLGFVLCLHYRFGTTVTPSTHQPDLDQMTIESIKPSKTSNEVFVMFILANGEAYEMTFNTAEEAVGYMNAINAVGKA